MNITPQVPHLSIPTVLNPHTESLRRENNHREIISRPAPTSQSTAEKGVASDRERSKTPAQNSANIDFARIREQTEFENSRITEKNEKQDGQQNQAEEKKQPLEQENITSDTAQESAEITPSIESANELTSAQALAQKKLIHDLKQRDIEVRTHEASHASIGGAFARSPSYSYELGPDGKKYATAGEVSIDVSPMQGDPKATINKMQQVVAAALAPENPSTQDLRVASKATQNILAAQSELLTELTEKEFEAQNINQEKIPPSTATSNFPNSEKSPSFAVDANLNPLLSNKSDNKNENDDITAPKKVDAIVKRSRVIERFYDNITQAYEKPPRFKFELTA